MRKKNLILVTVVALAASMTMQSCIGSFALFNKVKNWKQKLLTWNSFQPKEKQDNRYHAEEIDYEKYIANLQGGNL